MTNTIKGQPLAIHKNYFIRSIEAFPDSSATKELLGGLGCSTPDEAISKLKEFPGDWCIGGSLLSYDDPDLPEEYRNKDFCSGCLLTDKKVPPIENRGLCQGHIDLFETLENEGSV